MKVVLYNFLQYIDAPFFCKKHNISTSLVYLQCITGTLSCKFTTSLGLLWYNWNTSGWICNLSGTALVYLHCIGALVTSLEEVWNCSGTPLVPVWCAFYGSGPERLCTGPEVKLSGTALEHLYDVSGTCWYVLGPGLGTSLVRAGARNGSLRLAT